MISGKPICSESRMASSTVRTMPPSGTLRPISRMASRKSSRSSASWIVCRLAPISSTPYSSSTPLWASSTARFRLVWPPRVGSSASGRSFSMIFASASTFSGSM